MEQKRTKTAEPFAIHLGDQVQIIAAYRGFTRGTVAEILDSEHVAVDLDGYKHNPVDFHTCEIVN